MEGEVVDSLAMLWGPPDGQREVYTGEEKGCWMSTRPGAPKPTPAAVGLMLHQCTNAADWSPRGGHIQSPSSSRPPTSHPPTSPNIFKKKKKKSVLCVRPATLCVSAGGKKKKNGRPSCLFGWVGNKIRRRRLNPLTTASVGARGRHFAQLVASPCVMTTQRVLTCIVTLNSSFLSIWLFSRKRPRTKFQKKKKKTRKFCETRRCVRDRSSEPSVAIRTDGQHDTHSV